MLAGCAGRPSERSASEPSTTGPHPSPEAKAWLEQVQASACWRPVASARCTPGMRVVFANRDTTPAVPVRSGAVWCDPDGRPVGRFEGFGAQPSEGPIPLTVWESLWRVLAASRSRAVFDGEPLRVTRADGATSSTTSGFEVKSIIEAAAAAARRGPPPAVPAPDMSICAIDPGGCPHEWSGPCPPFTADPWNGLRTASPPTLDLDDEPYVPEGPNDGEPAPAAADPASLPSRPSVREVTRAVSAALPAARACLPPDEMARASIVFASTGAVQAVTVFPGTAPAKARCIERAFAGLRLHAFSDPTYATSVTVRR